jgi:hypothetical protein
VEIQGEDNNWFSGDVDALVAEILTFLTGERVSGAGPDRLY